ncbi:MAG: U32 family peptidase [Bacteroidales bacterium]|nr:U32 family peptidase [Bacteroidales bacterium]
MTALELLAPARNADIGIAAVRCGADAVYIAGPDYGARKDAGNPISEVERLCRYAHRFGVKVFLTVNVSLKEEELERVHRLMLEAQEAGVDAFIIRESAIAAWDDITVPLHASTQCAIRTAEKARLYQDLGCGRIVLERELSLGDIREIRRAVDCEIEFFVHGALCVGYSGECRLSQYLDGRSADRGECVQACRSLYTLVDSKGGILARDKALLSLKDFNLKNRLEDLARAGVMSFKIEGRLKNASYVKNVVRDYSDALDALCAKYPDRYCRASWGHPAGGFVPDVDKTFNRGYTQLWIDGRKGKWSSMDTPKSMGESIGEVLEIKPLPGNDCLVRIKASKPGLTLSNGDGFAFVTKDGITGFRADRAEGDSLRCRRQPDLKVGCTLFRNINAAFERSLENNMCERLVKVSLKAVLGNGEIRLSALTEDGRRVSLRQSLPGETALNPERSLSMLRTGLSKISDIYSFSLEETVTENIGSFPLLSSAFINGLRRAVAGKIDEIPPPAESRKICEDSKRFENERQADGTDCLLRSKYCIKYELGLCEKHFGVPPCGPLQLVNNGRRLALNFDCGKCEMTLTPVQK